MNNDEESSHKTDKFMDKMDAMDRSDTASMPSGPVSRTNIWPTLLAAAFFLIIAIVSFVDDNTGGTIIGLVMTAVALLGTYLNHLRAGRRARGIPVGPRKPKD